MGLFRPATLSEEDTKALIAAKLAWVLKGCEPGEVWVFGSAARAELTESSDIDLALIFESLEEMRAARRTLARTARCDNWPDDILYYTRSDFAGQAQAESAAMTIRIEGRRLYPPEKDRE